MARTGRPIREPKELKKERFSRNWETSHGAVKKEATSRVSQMLKWQAWQENEDAEGMLSTYSDEGVLDLINEARLLVGRIHDRTRNWTAAKNKIIGLRGSIEFMQAQIVATYAKLPDIEDQTEIDRLKNAIAEAEGKILAWEAEIPEWEAKMDAVESFQWECARKVTKNFCKVHNTIIALGGGNPDVENEDERDAFEEYEYDTREL
jgi:hypothetical protein